MDYIKHVLEAKNEVCTSAFNKQRVIVINGRTLTGHSGMDFVPDGYVVASDAGIVTKVKNTVTGVDTSGTNDYGNYIHIKLDDVYTIFFAHLKRNSLEVAVGDKVKLGERIAHMGNTGYSTGTHLHFGLLKNSVWIDPAPYLRGEIIIGAKVSATCTVTPALRIGVKVKVKSGAKYANTLIATKVPAWVCDNVYVVSCISSDGKTALLDANGLNSWLKTSDLIIQ